MAGYAWLALRLSWNFDFILPYLNCLTLPFIFLNRLFPDFIKSDAAMRRRGCLFFFAPPHLEIASYPKVVRNLKAAYLLAGEFS
jgi:hypothetical protein